MIYKVAILDFQQTIFEETGFMKLLLEYKNSMQQTIKEKLKCTVVHINIVLINIFC